MEALPCPGQYHHPVERVNSWQPSSRSRACTWLQSADWAVRQSAPAGLQPRCRRAMGSGTLPQPIPSFSCICLTGSLRGGISIELALSLPTTPFNSALLAATYAIVIFTIVVQDFTLGRVAMRALQAPVLPRLRSANVLNARRLMRD
ncbi:hypothetical protein RGR602_PC02063 (plasmid) [Rhizobium gallicum bv. gallicum R602sp]|uniref:Uncharacterized protein n=1 Tax=Rhizobium gallicum bv. gallicum R602sp TaxID=1041138 RepID=A0A0B4XG84_9HYPH|nr:hypothetical protein RGR602_PC02063 [Rhizobium gallicum bv. gallicum R602sp]